MICTLERLQSYSRVCRRMRRSRGDRTRAPMALIRCRWLRLVRMTGVHPRGAQLRPRGETSEKPLSSRKTSLAWSSFRFFYLRPLIAYPVRYRFVIALYRHATHFLTTPVHSIQDVPRTAGSVPYTKEVPNQMRNPVKCPVVICIPLGKSALQKLGPQSSDLFVRQASRSPHSPGLRPAFAGRLAGCRFPITDATGGDIHDPRNFAGFLAFLEQR